MTKIFVYAANKERAERAVQMLISAGAEHVELLQSLNLYIRQPKENRYLFICETPAEKLTALVPQGLPENEYAQELSSWFAAATATIAAFNAQKKRSILISDSQLNNLNALIDLINVKWTLALKSNSDSNKQEPNSHGGQLLAYLVQNLVNQTPELLSLSDQIAKLSGVEREIVDETEALIAYRGINQNINQLNADKQGLLDAKAALENQLKDSTEEAEVLLTQLHTVQEELERLFLESKSNQEAAEKEKAALAKEKADLTSARDAQAKAAKESTEESELLLNQLHQVQEELEYYFIKYKEADLHREKQQTRWQKILASHPDYVAFESIKATPNVSDKNTLSWSITGLENTNINRPQLEFETFVEAGVLGFRFNKDSGEKQSGLKSWPEFAKDLNVLEIIPVGKGEKKALRAKALKELSSTDWQLIQVLPKLIEEAVKDGAITLNEQQNVTEALQKFTRSIELLPKTLHYDAVNLKNCQVNPDYEHLWFVFENMSFGEFFWPKFEIRFGAAKIKPNGFSLHPKIEIPLIDGKTKPFDSWFEESRDDFGPKLELRFALPDELDLETLGKLSNQFTRLLYKFIESLPKLIKMTGYDKKNLSRNAHEWIDLAEKLKKTMEIHTN